MSCCLGCCNWLRSNSKKESPPPQSDHRFLIESIHTADHETEVGEVDVPKSPRPNVPTEPINIDFKMTSRLKKEIRGSLQLPESQNERWIPDLVLKGLISQARVEAILKSSQLKLDRSLIPKITQFVCEKAYRIFGTLIIIGKPELIVWFYEHDFLQEWLPIKNRNHTNIWEAKSCHKTNSRDETRPIYFCDDDLPWTWEAADQFCSWQWAFTAPVFGKGAFDYDFDKETRLPFTNTVTTKNNASSYSYVEERSVHVSHIEQAGQYLALDNAKNVRVAIKELKPLGNDIADPARREADVLKMMKGLKHDHLISAIAYYKKDSKHHFIFPLAEKGNLWEFWNEKGNSPKTDIAYIIWVFTQLKGLAGGISALHGQESGSCRHGDLKPENIICFKTRGNKPGSHGPSVRLVITDVGLAKVHKEATKVRGMTNTRVATKRYEAPEMETHPNGPLSRRFDVWSLGCLFLEFVIWLLYGAEELDKCTGILEQTYYEIQETYSKPQNIRVAELSQTGRTKVAVVHLIVVGWISYIKKDWRCPNGTALRSLVDLIETRLLLVKLLDPSEMNSLSRVNTGMNASINAQSQAMDPQLRAYAPEIVDKLGSILKGLKSKKMQPISQKSKNNTPIPKGPSHSKSTTIDGMLGVPVPDRFLNDEWDYALDESFARDVFNKIRLQEVLPQYQPPQMCDRCRGLQLWAPGFIFTDSQAGLAVGAYTKGCALCMLLLNSVQERVAGDTSIQFAQAGSHLTIDDGSTEPVLNIYSHLDSQKPLPAIQPGLPTLPRAGSTTHFRILAEWIRHCNNSHKCVRQRHNFVPTRLIDVGNSDKRVVLSDNSRCHTRKDYIALSHRWGPIQKSANFCTYKSNFDRMKSGIHIAHLPKTFQDAVGVTRSLGLRWLWIDSICIIQDDANDWEMEARLMEHVFSSAYCTIAASCASDNTDGFLKPRPKREYIPMLDPSGSVYYICKSIDDFATHVDQSELNQRGWVLQERALSRRTIYFTETQSYWECGEGVKCETMTKMKNRKASFLGDANFPKSVDQYVKGMKIRLFQDLYERYSRLKLSFPSDRPVAIKGLEARLLATFATTGGYGIFDAYLHHCLLWQREGRTFYRNPSSRGISVPSWSWMAYDGAISYLPIPLGKVTWRDDIISPFTMPEMQTTDGENTRAVQLTAQVCDVVDCRAGSIVLDDPDGTVHQHMQCVVIGESKMEAFGNLQTHWVVFVRIITTNSNELGQMYERVGVGTVERRQIVSKGREARIC